MSSEHLQTLCLPLWPPCCWLAQVSPPQDAVPVGFHQLLAFLLYFLLVLSYQLNTFHRQLTLQGLQGLLAFKAPPVLCAKLAQAVGWQPQHPPCCSFISGLCRCSINKSAALRKCSVTLTCFRTCSVSKMRLKANVLLK